ncbi:MAG: type II toxin-antitoxin system HigB family toxin [Bacteroidia bacterium]|nr:type II toxin-antitoxin system HigB family toxin [Bacteroidia bacterium]
MRVLSRKTLMEFWSKHPDSEQALRSWFSEVQKASWKRPVDIKKEHPTASFLADNRIVFNTKGNRYRLIVRIYYSYGQVFIRFIGTHSEYDNIDASTV